MHHPPEWSLDRRSLLCFGSAAAVLHGAAANGRSFARVSGGRRLIIDGQGLIYDPAWGDRPGTFRREVLAANLATGITACSMTLSTQGNAPGAFESTLGQIADYEKLIADNSRDLLHVRAATDILRARREHKIGIIFNTQDSAMIGTDLDRLSVLSALGVRVVQLTYNIRNLSGEGSLEGGNAGLSKLGRATISRIEQEKLLLDLAHAGQRTTAEGIAAATRPPTISHTGCRALNDNPRNQWDAELRACAEKGGIVGIYWMPFLVSNGKPTGADLVRHMEHARQVCGEDHVGIGTDGFMTKTVIDDKARADQIRSYEDRAKRGVAAPGEGPGIFGIVAEWDDTSRFEHLAHGLKVAGWSNSAIDKALGANLLRLYREVWAV